MIDVLSAETNFINAISAAISAEIQHALATYALLFAIGSLTLDAYAPPQ